MKHEMNIALITAGALLLAMLGAATLYSATAKTSPKATKLGETEYNAFKKTNSNFLQPDKKTDVKAGDTFCVELDTNPTTGFDWYLGMPKAGRQGSYSMISDLYFNLDKKQLAGSPSKRIIRYKAILKGETELVFKYFRSWEGEAKAEATKKFIVKIK